MASCSSRIHHQFIPFFISNPRHHEFLNVFCFLPWNSSSAEWRCTPDRRRLLPNALRNGALLPNSAHMSVSSLYQFLVLTCLPMRSLIYSRHMALWLWHDMSCLCVFMMVLGMKFMCLCHFDMLCSCLGLCSWEGEFSQNYSTLSWLHQMVVKLVDLLVDVITTL
jgi:hypothetical protein